MDKAQMKSRMLLILFAAALLVVALNFHEAMGLLGSLWHHISPVFIACVIAFVVNVPVSAISRRLRRLFSGRKTQPSDQLLNGVSFLLTLVILALILSLMVNLLVPQLIQSGKSIADTVRDKVPALLQYLQSLNLDTSVVEEYLQKIDLNRIVSTFTDNAGSILNVVAGTAASTIGAMATFVMALIIAIYIILDKTTLTHQAKAILYANLSRERADKVIYVASLTNRTYSRFLSGQCIEALILGGLLIIALNIAGVPYASVIGVTTAVMSFVPYVGAFLACAIGVILVLMVNPVKALVCLIVFLCVQFVEGHFIYPKVVGYSVGLPSMWTLIAVLIGGKLLGLLGMLFFIPLTAVVYTLITEDTHRKLKGKDIQAEC